MIVGDTFLVNLEFKEYQRDWTLREVDELRLEIYHWSQWRSYQAYITHDVLHSSTYRMPLSGYFEAVELFSTNYDISFATDLNTWLY